MKKIIFIIFITGIIFSGAIIFLFFYGYFHFNNPSRKEFPVRGIDISHHQGEIEWNKLNTDEFSFIFIKATEGGNYKDKEFPENWQNAKNRGFTVGAYHFYRLCKSGMEQAGNFIETVPKDTMAMPPVIDLEFGSNCSSDKNKKQILKEIGDFIDTVGKYYRKKVIIYTTDEFYNDYIKNNFDGCYIWIRNIYGKPELSDQRKWTFWQYDNRTHIDGIASYIDLNVFNGSREEFERFISLTSRKNL
ncbi:MAG: glycoside hydrolase family 25 protein [Bacteroidia bacterium]|nr:glycoside hydrolase family 25 protein [Bacteroidia bacterium]